MPPRRLGAAALPAAALLAAAPARRQRRRRRQAGESRAAKAAAARPARRLPTPRGAYARFASLCAACHGANGRSEIPGTPSLAGQHCFYAITQLFLFREGRRSNEAMTAVAKTLKDDDLRGFAAVIDDAARRCRRRRRRRRPIRRGWPRARDAGAPAQVRVLPRRRPERRPAGAAHRRTARGLPARALRGFKSGQRPGYTQAMTEAVSQVSVEELDTLAYYAARVSGDASLAPAAPPRRAPQALAPPRRSADAQRARSSACSVRIRLAIEASKNSRLSASSPANSRRASARYDDEIACKGTPP